MKALIVDDSRATRRMIGEILKGLGYEIIEAENGHVGLERLTTSWPIDIVMVDWNMPEMNGIEFVKAVRANEAYADLLMIMVTTETEMQRMALAFMAGVNEYVMKPFDKAALTEKLMLLGVGAE